VGLDQVAVGYATGDLLPDGRTLTPGPSPAVQERGILAHTTAP
jgi:hypothetical protein